MSTLCGSRPSRCAPCDPASHDSRSTPALKDRAWRRTTMRPMQSGRHGVLVQRTSRDRASPQDLVAAHRSLPFGHARAGHSHRNRAGHHGAYQRLGPVRPRADHRSIQGSGGPAGHASRRRGAGPARADWVGGGRPGQSVPANAVGLVAIACYRSTRSTSSAWTATHGPLNALECRSALFEPARGQG